MTKEDDIKPNIESIFSLLSQDQASAAVQELLQNFRAKSVKIASALKWAEFEMSGKFIRAGISDILEQTTEIIHDPIQDSDIKRLVNMAQDGAAEPGALHPVAGLDCFLWFVPYTPSNSNKISSTRLRAFCIWDALFYEILNHFNPLADLTAAERRVSFQIVAGISTRDAAIADDVSLETKRSQIKSLCRKLQCPGQHNVIRKLLGQLVHYLSISEAESAYAKLAEEFVARNLKTNAHLTIRRLSNGHIIRVLECGPPNGKPLIFIHGMMFAQLLKGLTTKLEELGLRLIIPIRHGHLESKSMSSLFEDDNFISNSNEDLALLLETFGPSPAVVIGYSMGATIAANFANRYPDLVSKLILLSPHLAQGIPTDVSIKERFHTSLNQLVTKPGVFRLIAWQFRKYYVDVKTVQKVLLKLFGGCSHDVDVLEGKYSGEPSYKMFTEHYQNSINGIAEDFSFVMSNWQHEFTKLRVHTTYLHGMADPVTLLEEYESTARHNPNAQIITLEDGGHFMALSHADWTWKQVSEIIKG